MTEPPDVRLALRKPEAAAALGISDESFDRYVRPSLPVVYLGSIRVYPVRAIEQWLERERSSPMDAVVAARRRR